MRVGKQPSIGAISRRELLAGGVAASAPRLVRAQTGKRPLNVLFLMCDQYRPDALSRFGDGNAITPVLDSLAASGVSFRQTYGTTPVCVASRNSILTGRYSHSTGVVSNAYRANRTQISFAQVMRAKGYKTACFGKLHTPGREDLDWDVLAQGKDKPQGGLPAGSVVLPHGLSTDGRIPIGAPDPYPETATLEWRATENTIAFMRENRERPWLVQCSFEKPHPPFQPPKRYWDMIDRSKLAVPSYPEDDLEDANPRYWEGMKGRGMDRLSAEQVRDGMQGYYGNIAFSDQLFGKVLRAVDDLRLRENTLVVFTADHGEMLYDHRLWTKMVFFDPSVRVPLFMRLPGVLPAGTETKALVEQIDIFPTLMDLLGFETPASVQGRSLAALGKGKTATHRPVARSEYPNGPVDAAFYNPTMMQFDGRFKLVDNGSEIAPELYDTETDPREITNLCRRQEHQQRVQSTLRELRAWVKQDAAPLQRKAGNR